MDMDEVNVTLVFLVGVPSSAVFAVRFLEADLGVAWGFGGGDFTSSLVSVSILVGTVAASPFLMLDIVPARESVVFEGLKRAGKKNLKVRWG